MIINKVEINNFFCYVGENIFDFDNEIYGRTLRVFVKKHLRAEVKYNNLEDLIKQIDQDKINSLEIL